MAYSMSSDTGLNYADKIFFVAILRNEEILVKYAQMAGNYDQVLSQVYDKTKAFKFLEHIKNKFESQYQRRVHTALPFAFHAEFLPTLVLETRRYSENYSFDRINEVQNKIEETRQILCEDIDKLTDRGEKLHLLVDKSDQLSDTAITFKVSSRNLARSLFLKNIRLLIGLGFFALIVIYLIVSLACGGLAWQRCVHK